MKPTRILKIDPFHIDLEAIKYAAEIINNRGLVAFPTETVYGLGVNALDPKAVAGVFKAKDRPLDDPLIVHISDIKDLYRLVLAVPPEAERLVSRFWPGALTMIFKKTDIVPDIVTTGLDTVAVRMPSNIIARNLIKAVGAPIAAPSANAFGRPSPTKAKHVMNDLEGKIDLILDGGSTEIGIESTVAEFRDGKVIVLRPGGIDIEQLRFIAGKGNVSDNPGFTGRAPGEYPRHYSPKARVIPISFGSFQKDDTERSALKMKEEGYIVGIMAIQEHENDYKGYNVKILGPKNDGRICASRLFNILREFDEDKVDVIIAEGIPERGLGRAIMDRIKKASGESGGNAGNGSSIFTGV